ncbi:MAG: OmpA family protein [Micavibrio sp.]
MRIFGKSMVVFGALAAASIALSGCATPMPWSKDKRAGRAEPPVTISERPVSDSSVTIAPAPQGYGASDYKSMAAIASGGSVEIYNLNTGGAYGGGDMARIPARTSSGSYDGGMPLATDSSVTVYPVGGGAVGGFDGGFAPVEAQNMMGMGLYDSTASGFDGGGGTGAPAPRTGQNISSVYFEHGSAALSPRDRDALRSVAETAKFAPVDRVVVEGYASPQVETSDPVEGRILNLRQSLKRAGKVAETLIDQGVPAEKIKTVGWGDTKPSGGAETQQRRVDIVTAPVAAGGGYPIGY